MTELLLQTCNGENFTNWWNLYKERARDTVDDPA